MGVNGLPQRAKFAGSSSIPSTKDAWRAWIAQSQAAQMQDLSFVNYV